MSTPTSTKEASLTLKLSQEDKEKLEKAAAMRCLNLSEYILELVLDEAGEEIPSPEQIVLNDTEWEAFVSAIENPPELNPKLKAAIKKYRDEYE